MTSPRSGFALLTVLWVIVTVSVIVSTIGAQARRTSIVLEHARDQLQGRWIAEGCIHRLEAVLNATMSADVPRTGEIWRQADRVVRDSMGALTACPLSMQTDGRLVLGRASADELAALPGMSPEAVARVLALQQSGVILSDLIPVGAGLSPVARALFESNYARLSQMLVAEPDAWLVRVHGYPSSRPGAVGANIVVRIARSGSRVAVMRWVEW